MYFHIMIFYTNARIIKTDNAKKTEVTDTVISLLCNFRNTKTIYKYDKTKNKQ